jgi:hypothetical protein
MLQGLRNCLVLWAGVCAVKSLALAQTQTDLFDSSILHTVNITMAPSDWQGIKAHYLDDTDFPVTTFQWQGKNGLTASVGNFLMHNRGHGSQSPIKPGLHLDFTNPNSGNTLLGLNSLELKPNTQDASLVHERISMLLFQRMGVPAPREVSSRFYVNGEYIGVYLLVEFPDGNFTNRLWGESNGYNYNYAPGDWQGIVNAGWHFEYIGDNLGTTKDSKGQFPYASSTDLAPFVPENHSNAPDTVTLQGWIQAMNQVSDANFISTLSNYLDLKAWLRHVAVETYVADFDCILGDIFGLNNFRLYRFLNRQVSPSVGFSTFIAWDKDNAFDWTQRPVLQNAAQNVLMNRLMNVPEYRNSYFESILQAAMMAGGAGGWLQNEAVFEYNQIQQAAYEDPNKLYLNNGALLGCDNNCFDAANSAVQAFPDARTRFVISDIDNQGYTFPATAPQIADGGVINAAAILSPAAGGLASIYGTNLGDTNTMVLVNGYAAPLLYGSPGQLNLQAPWESTGYATLGAVVNGSPSNIAYATVATYSPGVFVATHVDGSVVSE